MNPRTRVHIETHPSRRERRALLRTGASLGVAAALASAGSATPMNPNIDRLGLHDFKSFTDAWRALTDEHLGAGPGAGVSEAAGPGALELDLYLHRLTTEIRRLSLDQVPEAQRIVFENERFTTGPAHHDGEIFLVVATMQPNAELPPHNHPNHIVATTCLSGSARYRHFELPDSAPPIDDRSESFPLRETRSGLLTPGRTTHLSRERDNVHTFTAGPQGAVLLDFTIELGPGGGFGMLDIEPGATEPFVGEFKARWMDVKF